MFFQISKDRAVNMKMVKGFYKTKTRVEDDSIKPGICFEMQDKSGAVAFDTEEDRDDAFEELLRLTSTIEWKSD